MRACIVSKWDTYGVEIGSAEKLENRVPSVVGTPELWNNGGLPAGPTSPGSFSPVLWRCLSGSSSHCMLPSLVFSMFISLARHLCTLLNALCSYFSVRKKTNYDSSSKAPRHASSSLLV